MGRITITKWLGRFGNNVMQMAHAIYLAEELGLEGVIHPLHDKFLGHEIEIGHRHSAHDDLRGDFFYGHSVLPYARTMTAKRRKEIFLKYLLPRYLQLEELESELSSDLGHAFTLAIHVRSGDVFSSKSHRGYVQPPLWFYLQIIHERAWQKIYLVSEDQKNPVIPRLLADFPKMERIGGTFFQDFAVLRQARNLVGSCGTFTHAAFCFNSKVERYWLPDYLNDSKDFTASFPDQVRVLDCPCYIKVGEWVNSPDQRRLMLEYSP